MTTYWNTIWDKVSADIKEGFDSESVYNKKFWKTKIQSYGDEITDFYNKETPKMDSNNTSLGIISLDSDLKKDENYFLQVFLKECKYTEKKVIRHIDDILSDLSYSGESDEE